MCLGSWKILYPFGLYLLLNTWSFIPCINMRYVPLELYVQSVCQYTPVDVTQVVTQNSLKTDENGGINHDIHFVKNVFKTKTNK